MIYLISYIDAFCKIWISFNIIFVTMLLFLGQHYPYPDFLFTYWALIAGMGGPVRVLIDKYES